AAEVFRAADEAGVIALEAMRPLHDPAFHQAAGLLDGIGTVRRATLRFGKYSSRYDDILAGKRTNIFDCDMASGALMDIGVYCVEPMIALFGEPDSISCAPALLDEATRELTHGPIDGAGVICARYAGKVVTLHYSKITADLAENQVEGELGTWTLDAISTPSHVRIDMRGVAVRNAAKQMGYSSTETQTTEVDLPPCENSMCHELADFVTAVEAVGQGAPAGSAPCGPFGDTLSFRAITLASLRVMDEARRQAGVVFPADRA
ncbi:MAG: gfo/Idh/MocA family oxidoreductase, partial [Collinsella sp.]|nr:gfo/Idh/MocA family oxidoreductase [Collinsella sp.]